MEPFNITALYVLLSGSGANIFVLCLHHQFPVYSLKFTFIGFVEAVLFDPIIIVSIKVNLIRYINKPLVSDKCRGLSRVF